MTLYEKILFCTHDWSRIGQIAERVGISRQQAKLRVTELVILVEMEQMGARFRRKASPVIGESAWRAVDDVVTSWKRHFGEDYLLAAVG